MNSTERVRRTILGQETDRQPIYGWVSANLSNEITAAYGSVAAFEDKYEYDDAHLFAGPGAFRKKVIDRLRAENEELTPDLLLDEDIFTDPDVDAYYDSDLSLAEIAEDEGISRQGVRHIIKKGEEQLSFLEEKLGLCAYNERLVACTELLSEVLL